MLNKPTRVVTLLAASLLFFSVFLTLSAFRQLPDFRGQPTHAPDMLQDNQDNRALLIALRVADPAQGAIAFHQYGCANCHGFDNGTAPYIAGIGKRAAERRTTPDDAEAHAFLTLAYFSTERVPEALEEGRRAVNLDPESIDTNTAYAIVLNAVRRSDQALEYYKKAASINPRLEHPYFNLGFLARVLGNDNPVQFDIAIEAYNQVLSTNRRSVKAYIRLCQTYHSKGEPNLALDNCTTATNIDPDNAEAWLRLGYVQYFARDYENAAKSLTQCYDREQPLPPDERWTECWSYLGLSYALFNQCEKALPIFYDLLQWTDNEYAIDLTNRGLTYCQPPA